ncbi:MAG: DUF1501 domain-containing protein [Planctomycetes bacterium]|nr:DUF1501 domain-containing protein [Planctomycetota bacterium]
MQYLNRRQVLQHTLVGALGLGALGRNPSRLFAEAANPLAPKSPHFTPRAKRVILFFMPGGVSHVDTFDPKPALRRDHGKPFGKGRVLTGSRWDSRPCGQSGLEISDLFPHLAQSADDLCLIRSMHGDKGDHFEATLGIHSGATAGTLPGIGAWISYGLGTENPNLPSHVVFCERLPYAGAQAWDSNFLPAYHQGTRITPGDEPIPNLRPSGPLASHQAGELELLQWMNARHRDARPADSVLGARMYSFEAAVGLQQAAPEAFDLADESNATLELYGVKPGDRTSFAWQCLMARRMTERGVRFIELVDKGASGNWDAHSKMQSYDRLAANVDRPMAALITDLKRRGLFDETLIVWCTEFGRTPSAKQDQQDGRDHYKDAFTCWLAGGGVKGGKAVGATDEHGLEIVENPVHINDFHATILHLLGFDHTKLTYFFAARNFRLTGLAGKVVHQVLS